jgi:hypothetical protein
MKWKIEGTDQSGDDVIVMVDADDVETATKQANFAGVKVKAIHADEASHPAVKLPPTNSPTTPGLATPPPGYTGKVIIEREEDERGSAAARASHRISDAVHNLHAPHADAGVIVAIASHIIALTLLVIGLVVFVRGWIQYGRVPAPLMSYDENPQAAMGNTLLLSLQWQQSLAYIGHMLIGLLIIIIAILIEGFLTRMVVNIRETWHMKKR